MKLRHRLDRPSARVAAAIAVREWVHAMIDISDGLAQDLGHILAASGVGAELELGRLPVSGSLLDFHPDDAERWRLQLAGGDDYELCFTAPPQARDAVLQAGAASATPVTRIGCIEAHAGLRLVDAAGEPVAAHFASFDHFAD